MNLNAEQQDQLARFPAPLRALVETELAAGNTIAAIETGFPAAPCGASIRLANSVGKARRKSTGDLSFYERNNSSYSGEFTTAERHFFVLEPPLPPPPDPDMDAIRKSLEPKPTPLSILAQREAGAGMSFSAVSHTNNSRSGTSMAPAPDAAEGVSSAPHFTHIETDTGWTRLLHFVDELPPHQVQYSLERELMVLFVAGMDGPQLRMMATADVNGAPYTFELRFLAVIESSYYYSLRTEVSWADADPKHHAYFRKTSDSWFKMWTRILRSTPPPDGTQNLLERYERITEEALLAQQQLDSIAALQNAIVEGMKQGGTYGTSHKEGGTNIYWRVDRFVRSDYGDYPDLKNFTSEADFLKMLWNFCQFDVKRHAGKQGLSELDTWKLILRRMNDLELPVAQKHPPRP